MFPSLVRKRGRQPPPIGIYCCTGCACDKPTIRDGVHVNCTYCNAEPNHHLARLWNLPDWPLVVTAVQHG
jgi:hypothetical protein